MRRMMCKAHKGVNIPDPGYVPFPQEHSAPAGVGLASWAKHDGYSSGQSASTLQQVRQLLLASAQFFPHRDVGSDGPDDPAQLTCDVGWIGGSKRYPT